MLIRKSVNVNNTCSRLVAGLLFLAAGYLLADTGEKKDWVTDTFLNYAGGEAALISDINDAYGVVFDDLTSDGRPDLYIVRFRDLNRLFINRGNKKTFRDRTIRSGLGGNLSSRGEKNLELGASAVDFNNDGNQDILITGWDKTTHLFRGEGNLGFADITDFCGLERPVSGNCGVWSDIDLDGDLDLFITNEHGANQLYLQLKPGNFRECAREFGVDAEQISQGAMFGDLNGDGYPDLYVCNWFAPDILYTNSNGKKFKRITSGIPHLTDPLRSNGVWFGDYDNDGDLDILVTDRQRTTQLYRNEGEWNFEAVSTSIGLVNNFPAYSGLMADFDNNGWQDIYFTNIGPNQLFLNYEGHFELAYEQKIKLPSNLKHYSTGAAIADYDNDGDLDLFVANKDTASKIYVNQIDSQNFIRFKLQGGNSNRDAIGSKIRLYGINTEKESDSLISYREVSGGGGYLSTGEKTVHFGVASEGVYRAEVVFPGGKIIQLNDLLPGKTITVHEHNFVWMWLFNAEKAIRRMLARPEFGGNLFLLVVLAGLISGYSVLAVTRYKWSPIQMIGFIGGTIIIMFVGFIFLPDYGLRSVLWGQLVLLLLIISTVTGFSERLYQLSTTRQGYRKVLKQFSDQLIQIHDNDDLFNRLLEVVHTNLKTESIALAIKENNVYKITSGFGTGVVRGYVFTIDDRKQAFLSNNNVIVSDQLKTLFKKDVLKLFETLLVIQGKDGPHALLLLGRRESRLEYDSQDIDILTILARQAALAVDNNFYIEEIQAMTEKMAQAEVRKKYIRELEDKNLELETMFRDLKTTQAQLIQSEKMSSLGQLVAGIAHELNNPIGFIYANLKELGNYLEILKNSTDKQELDFVRKDVDQLIDDSIVGSERVRDIVDNLRNFSRLDEAEFKKADIHEGINSTLMLLNNEFKDRIDVQRNFGGFDAIECLPGYLNQVFMNLLQNAGQAISGQGKIDITTRKTDDSVQIIITDDGKGIPADKIDRIFEPFYTSKPVGAGTGLGLSISYGIIERHNGTIAVESIKGKGSKFTITLPITQG